MRARALVIAALVALAGIGSAYALTSGPTTKTYTYTVPKRVVTIPGQTYTQTVAVPTVTLRTTVLVTTTAPATTSTPPPTTTAVPPATLTVAPGGDWNAVYQRAKPGDVISVSAGSYGGQTLGYRSDLANLTGACTYADQSRCIRFVMAGPVTVGKLEIRGSDVYIAGGEQLNSTGYIDTEADSATNHPDHVVVDGAHTTSFGIFNADTVMFRDLDVGPATTGAGGIEQGAGFESKIGSAGGVVYTPRNLVLDWVRIHDQNGDAGRLQTGDHFGGLFLSGADGLTISHTVFQGNVVYNVQIQPINGDKIANIKFDHDSFACPVNWLYQNQNPLACDGQASIQFDGTFPDVTISNSASSGGLYGCYVGTCDYSKDTFANNATLPDSTTAPALP